MQQTAPARMASVRGIALRVLLAVGVVTVGGCTQKDAYVPPDICYLFTSYAVEHNPNSVTAAVRNDKLKVFLGNGDGSFVEGPLYEYGDTPTSIAAADLNRDGNLDVAVSNGGPMSSAVSIWLGNGNGTFREPTDYRTGKRPLVVPFAHFNNDRMGDLLVITGAMDTL